jgi:hypothetical protein
MSDLMNTLTAWVAFVAGLSVATERITEIIKGFIERLSLEKAPGKPEEVRKAIIQIIAIVVGGVLAFVTYGQIQAALKLPGDLSLKLGVCLVFGAMASGGSGMWNSALDIVREVNKQKQVLTEKLKK